MGLLLPYSGFSKNNTFSFPVLSCVSYVMLSQITFYPHSTRPSRYPFAHCPSTHPPTHHHSDPTENLHRAFQVRIKQIRNSAVLRVQTHWLVIGIWEPDMLRVIYVWRVGITQLRYNHTASRRGWSEQKYSALCMCVCVKTAYPDEWTDARTHEWTIGQAKRLLQLMKWVYAARTSRGREGSCVLPRNGSPCSWRAQMWFFCMLICRISKKGCRICCHMPCEF